MRALLIAVAALWGLYVVALNGVLWTPLFGKLANADPVVIDIHYARAWSLLPQHVHVEGLSIRGTDSNVEWILKLDKVDFTVSLKDLARQYFHCTKARGSGVSFRMRMKVPSPAETERFDELRPPIDGLTELSIKPDDPPYAGTWDDSQWKLFTIQLDDIVATDVREVWVGHTRVLGSTRIAGGFHLTPIREVRLGPIDLDLAPESRIELANEPLLEHLAGTAHVQIDSFDPRGIATDQLLHHVSARADVRGAVVDLANLGGEVYGADALHGAATFAPLALRIDHGVLANGTDVDVVAPALRVAIAGHEARGGVHVNARVANARLDGRVWIEAPTVDPVGRAHQIDATFDSTRLDLGVATFEDLHGTVDGRDVNASLAATAKVVAHDGASWRIDQGRARGDVHAEGWLPAERVRGETKLTLEGVEARADGATVALPGATVDANGEATLETKTATGSVAVRARRARFATGDKTVAGDLDAHVNAVRIAWGKGLAVEGGRAQVAIAQAKLVVNGATADSERLTVQAHVDAAGGVLRGDVAMRGRRVAFASHDLHVAGEVDARADVTSLDPKGERVGVRDARVSLVGVTGGLTDVARTDFTVDRVDARVAARDFDLSHPSLAGVGAELHVPRAELRDARALNRFLPSGPLFAIESGSAVVRADVTTRPGEEARAGEIVVDVPDATVRFHDERVTGNVHVDARLAQKGDAPGRTFDVEGTQVLVQDARVSGSSADTAKWNGKLVVDAGTVRLDPPRIDADVRLVASDARPVLALALGRAVPGFVIGMIDMPELDARTHLRFERDLVALTGTSAQGTNFALHGVYVVRGEHKLGAFIAEKQPVSVGVRLDDDGAHPRFFGLDDWYRGLEGGALRLACAPDAGVDERCDLPSVATRRDVP